MDGFQQTAGLCIMLLGLLAFLDRERPTEARHNYYWYDARVGVIGRTVAALVAITIGAVLLFAA